MKPQPKSKPAALTEHHDERTHDVMPLEWAHMLDDGYLIAIDPGLNGTGVAVWEANDLVSARVINVPSKLSGRSWPQRADFIAQALMSDMPAMLARKYWLEHATVVCEFPEGFGGVKMMAWKTGDLQRLTYLVGLFSGAVSPARFVPVLVHDWKGQLPKNVVIDRLKKRMGAKKVAEIKPELHAWDAIGIGMWARGEF